MVSNFQFVLKALRFPGTAPILLALSLTAFLGAQFNSLLSSQAALQPSPDEDDEPDQSPEANSLSPVALAPLAPAILPELLPPQPLPSDSLSPDSLPPEPLPQAEFRLDLSPLPNDVSQHFEQSLSPANLDITLPKPLPVSQAPQPSTRKPPRSVQVAPELVTSAVSQTLAYQPLRSNVPNVPSPSSVMERWTDLADHWSRPYVEALASLGLIHGSLDGQFEPDRPITRAELARLLQHSLPRAELTPEIVLQDVPSTHWAAASIDQAVRMGFFPDTEATHFFNPDRPASRLVTWGAIVSGLDLPSSKQHNELLQAWEASRVNAPTATQLSTQEELNQPVTRAEAVALLYHALRLTEQGQNLAAIAPESVQAQLPAQQQSVSGSAQTPAVQDAGSLREQNSPSVPTPVLASHRSTVTVSPPQEPSLATGSERSTAEIQPEKPLLVAAQLPLPDPLLSPLPPVAEEPDSTPDQLQSSQWLQPPEQLQPVERLSPEFAADPHPAQMPLTVSVEGSPLETTPAAVDQTYRLGPGDRVFIEVFGLPQYSQEYQVLVDGSLNLPRAGRMVVEGMTLAEAETLIYGRYGRYYQQPATSVVLVSPRSLRLAVTGAVNRPGVYRLSPGEGVAAISLTQALQEAGGVDSNADLRQVKVYRSQRDGQLQELVLNLWNLLQSGDLDQDISLRDGDRVVIPQAEALSIEELNQIATANIAPSAIEVTVVGSDAESQGSLKLSPNTPLNQVVLAAGGFNDRRESRTVNLIRLHANGTVEQRLVDVPIAADVNEINNPILRDKDVIVLDRSKGSAIREGTLGFLGNILRVIPFVNLFF